MLLTLKSATMYSQIKQAFSVFSLEIGGIRIWNLTIEYPVENTDLNKTFISKGYDSGSTL